MTTFDSKKYYPFGEQTHFKDYFGTTISIGDTLIVPNGHNSLYSAQVLTYSNATINGSLCPSTTIIHKLNDDIVFTAQRLKQFDAHFLKYPENHKRSSLAPNSKSFVIILSDIPNVFSAASNGSIDNLFIYKTTVKYKTAYDLDRQLSALYHPSLGFTQIGFINGKGEMINPSTLTSASSTLTYLNAGLFGVMPTDTPILFRDFLRAVGKVTNRSVYNMDKLHPKLKRIGDYYWNDGTPNDLKGVLSYADI